MGAHFDIVGARAAGATSIVLEAQVVSLSGLVGSHAPVPVAGGAASSALAFAGAGGPGASGGAASTARPL